ncbi:MAG: DUF1287 domain-containing protein [Acidobacteriota bacterium]
MRLNMMAKNRFADLLLVGLLLGIVMTVTALWYWMLPGGHDPGILDRLEPERICKVPLQVGKTDSNHNGVPDALDIVAGARLEVANHTQYDGSYCSGGFPPPDKGVCSDVIWRALRAIDYDLKTEIDRDISEVPQVYGSTGQRPDPNIDFRRVRNLKVFFQRHGQVLTTQIKPWDVKNLVQWQPGDIVVYAKPYEHIGIVSDKRRADGVPLLIHNGGPYASEADVLQDWPSTLVYHFRFID